MPTRACTLDGYRASLSQRQFRHPDGRGTTKAVESPGRNEIVVFWIIRDSACAECGEELGKGRFLRLEAERSLCLRCADLDHLVFLARGDTALTRRARRWLGNVRPNVVRNWMSNTSVPSHDAWGNCFLDPHWRSNRLLPSAPVRSTRAVSAGQPPPKSFSRALSNLPCELTCGMRTRDTMKSWHAACRVMRPVLW